MEFFAINATNTMTTPRITAQTAARRWMDVLTMEALLPGAKLRLPVGGEERTERGCTILRVNWGKAYILVEYFAGKRMKETFKIAVEE